MKKNKELAYIFLVLVFFTGAVSFLGDPIKSFMTFLGLPSFNATLNSSIILRTFILLLLIIGIFRLGFQTFNGFESWYHAKHFQAWFGLLLFCGLIFSTNYTLFIETDSVTLVLFIFSNILIGLTEEFIFRGTILPLFIMYFKNKKYVLAISILFSSLLFGIGHYSNIFSQSMSFEIATNQVLMASIFGLILGVIILRTKNLIFVSILHGVLNIGLSSGRLRVENSQATDDIIQEGMGWANIGINVFLIILLIFIGLYLIKKVNKREILNTLE